VRVERFSLMIELSAVSGGSMDSMYALTHLCSYCELRTASPVH